MVKDMTKGEPIQLMIWFSIPLLIGNVFQQFYNMADTIIVGRTVGVQALAAVGSTGAVTFLIFGFVMGLTSGFAVITAQRFGAGDMDGMRRSVGISILLSAGFTVVLTAGSMLAASPMLRLMNTPADIFDDAYSYLIVIFAGVGSSFFYNTLSSILRALGDSKTPLYFLIIASLLNIVLDFVCILWLHQGVAGAAYATVTAQLTSGVLCLFYMIKRFPVLHMHREDWRMDRAFVKEHLRVGLPMAFQFSITAVGIMVLQGALNRFGSTVVAAYTAASKVEMIFTQPMFTLGVTAATYTAQNLGAQKYARIREGLHKGMLLTICIALFSGTAVTLLGRFFVSIFIDTPTDEIFSYGQTYLNTIAVFFIALGLLALLRNALQGMGSAFMPMMAGVAELVMRTVVCLLLPQRIGFIGVCLASPLAWIGALLPLVTDYIRQMRRIPVRDAQRSWTNEDSHDMING